MIWILATRGASTVLRNTPFTETVIDGVHSVIYKPGIEPKPSGGGGTTGLPGEFERGLHRVAGVLYSYHGSVAEELLRITEEIDLVVRYRANGEHRKRTLQRILFIGDALVTFPSLNQGVSTLIGVPFRLQIPEGETLDDHITDAADPTAAA